MRALDGTEGRVEELEPDKFGARDERRLSGEASLSQRTL